MESDNFKTKLQYKKGCKMKSENIIPLIIIGLFFIGITLVGKIASKKISTSNDYIVAGRGAPLFLVVGTLFATFWGGGTIIGATGAAYNDGMFGVLEDPFAAGLSLILIGLFFVTTLRKLKIRSIGELYSFRFGKITGYLASALMIPTYVIWTAVQLLAIGKILNIMFEVNFNFAFLIAVLVVVSFTCMGGLVAVVWTDAIQMIIIFIGLIFIMFTGYEATGGIVNIINNTPKNFWSVFPKEKNFISWISYLAIWAGMALGNVPSPDIAQRAFMAKNEKTAKLGMLIAGSLYWILGFIPVFIALMGITLVSDGQIPVELFAKDSELLIPFLSKYLFGPIGLGIFVASLLAAIMSSASTSLFATAVLFSNDIFKPIGKSIKKISPLNEDKIMLKATRGFVILVGVLSSFVGLMSTNIYSLTIFAFTLQFGVLFFPYVFALKSKNANTHGIIAGMLGGFLVNMIGVIGQLSVIPKPWQFFTLVPALINLILIIFVSYLTRHKSSSVSLDKLYIKI